MAIKRSEHDAQIFLFAINGSQCFISDDGHAAGHNQTGDKQ